MGGGRGLATGLAAAASLWLSEVGGFPEWLLKLELGRVSVRTQIAARRQPFRGGEAGTFLGTSLWSGSESRPLFSSAGTAVMMMLSVRG